MMLAQNVFTTKPAQEKKQFCIPKFLSNLDIICSESTFKEVAEIGSIFQPSVRNEVTSVA